MEPARLARWLWFVVPVAVMLSFYGAVLLSLGLVQQATGGIDPSLLFYVPFLSVIPPLVLLAVWYSRKERGGPTGLVITTSEDYPRDVCLGLTLAAVCVGIFVGSAALLRWLSLSAPDLSALGPVHILFFSTVGALVPGVAEEVYFRGFLMQRFRNLRPATLVLLTSLSFASWHVTSPPYLLHTFLIGMILGVAYQRTRRLLPVMTGHTLANSAAGVLILTGVL